MVSEYQELSACARERQRERRKGRRMRIIYMFLFFLLPKAPKQEGGTQTSCRLPVIFKHQPSHKAYLNDGFEPPLELRQRVERSGDTIGRDDGAVRHLKKELRIRGTSQPFRKSYCTRERATPPTSPNRWLP